MTPREATARAMAYFDGCDDIVLLHKLTAEISPRARKIVARFLERGNEDGIPPPADLRAAAAAAPLDEALRTLRSVDDFALFQLLARSIGRRIEAIEIAASADFPVGIRVVVPGNPAVRTSPRIPGIVEQTGTMLQVLLENGETWQGPPTLAKLAPKR